jgi:hypothetical protein
MTSPAHRHSERSVESLLAHEIRSAELMAEAFGRLGSFKMTLMLKLYQNDPGLREPEALLR